MTLRCRPRGNGHQRLDLAGASSPCGGGVITSASSAPRYATATMIWLQFPLGRPMGLQAGSSPRRRSISPAVRFKRSTSPMKLGSHHGTRRNRQWWGDLSCRATTCGTGGCRARGLACASLCWGNEPERPRSPRGAASGRTGLITRRDRKPHQESRPPARDQRSQRGRRSAAHRPWAAASSSEPRSPPTRPWLPDL